jgi:UDP-glucuronate decarboxylase
MTTIDNRGKRILVTGGAGFIGSHLCTRLLNEGAEVICLDNFFTGRKSNIAPLMDNPRFDVVRHDVIEPFHIDADEIYHLACPASPVHYQMHPVDTIKTSVMGSINALELSHRKKARVMLASTSEVYGDPIVHPQTEDYRGNVSTTGPRACYDEGKRCAESLFFDYHRQYGVNVCVARIFNTYGPHLNMNDGRVVSNFIVQALKGEDLTIYGKGTQTRSFCFVSDLVDGFIRLMNAGDFRGPVNLGNPGEFTMLELAEEVIAQVGSSSKLTFKPLPQDDPLQRCPNIRLAKEKLGWEPKVSLKEGLAPTIAYFRQVLEKSSLRAVA